MRYETHNKCKMVKLKNEATPTLELFICFLFFYLFFLAIVLVTIFIVIFGAHMNILFIVKVKILYVIETNYQILLSFFDHVDYLCAKK